MGLCHQVAKISSKMINFTLLSFIGKCALTDFEPALLGLFISLKLYQAINLFVKYEIYDLFYIAAIKNII